MESVTAQPRKPSPREIINALRPIFSGARTYFGFFLGSTSHRAIGGNQRDDVRPLALRALSPAGQTHRSGNRGHSASGPRRAALNRPGFIVTAMRWTPDGSGDYVARPTYERTRPVAPAPANARPRRWSRGEIEQAGAVQGCLL